MWTLLIVTALVTLYAGGAYAVCGVTPPVWRNHNFTCPERAICADVFKTPRDWYNGTTCDEERVLYNCLCTGNAVCPIDEEHLLYATGQHLMYTCQPKCTLPYCPNVRIRNNAPVAMTNEQNSPEFGSRNFIRIHCRCPRHHVPHTQSPGVHRAVYASGFQQGHGHNRFITQYSCNNRGTESQTPDICDQASINQQ